MNIVGRTVDKREYVVIIRDNFCYFYINIYVVTSHLNGQDETVHIRGHNIINQNEQILSLIINKYSLLSRALTQFLKTIKLDS